jgi:hypothetical protein
VSQNSTTEVKPTPLDIARPLAGSMDQAIGEATTVMGAVMTELMRRSLRGGVLKVGEQLESYVGECVALTIAESRPVIEETAATVAEQTAHSTAAKIVGEEVYALEQRTTEATRSLAGQIEEADRRAKAATTEVAQTLTGRIDEKAQHLAAEIQQKEQQLATRIDAGDQHVIQVTHDKARELTGQIAETAKRVTEATQAEIGQRVQELMDKAKEGAVVLKARIQAVVDTTAELGQRFDGEREARQAAHAELGKLLDRLTHEVRELRQHNDKLSARVVELERPRGLRRLWLWLVGLFRRGKR